MLLDNALSGLNPFHYRHGDIHQDEIWLQAVIFRDSRGAISSLTGDLTTKRFDDAGQVLPGKHRIIYYQKADWLPILTLYWYKLLHNRLPATLHTRLGPSTLMNRQQPALNSWCSL